MTGVLSGIRVLDFGRYLAGPFCAALLGDLGAEVIRIEQPAGGEDRYLLPIGSEEGGVVMMQMGRNKKGMTLNLGAKESADIIARLVLSADVVIANLPTPVLEKIGLDYQTLKAIKENIILTTTTAFGEGGPYSKKVGFDGVAQAMAGSMHMTGDPDSPMKASVAYVDYATASLSAFTTMAALYEVKNGGKGQHVETSLLSSAITLGSGTITEQAHVSPNRVASGNRAQSAGPADCFQTKDGW
ncbi:MAG: CoA transferase, partial [Pseudomonadales bacterium]|nr:CoA transferase [Pseudomonadales bacterium]